MTDPDDLGESESRGFRQIAEWMAQAGIPPETTMLGYVLLASTVAFVVLVLFIVARGGVA